jgi:hypothetical protein
MSTLFNEENFLKKLENILPTQDSIQSLALWIIHHKSNYEAIAKNWFKKLKECKLQNSTIFIKIYIFFVSSIKLKAYVKSFLSRKRCHSKL